MFTEKEYCKSDSYIVHYRTDSLELCPFDIVLNGIYLTGGGAARSFGQTSNRQITISTFHTPSRCY